jgi:hypothetical protein
MADKFSPDEIARFERRLAEEQANKTAMTHFRAPIKFDNNLEGVHMYRQGPNGEISDIPAWMKVGAGAAYGMQDVGRNLMQMVAPSTAKPEESTEAGYDESPYPQTESQRNALARALALRTTPGKIGHFVGETAASLPIGEAVNPVSSRVFSGAGVGSQLGRGAIEGAAQGAVLAPEGDKRSGAFWGGLGGAAVPGLAGIKNFLVRGVERTPAAMALQRRGVDLTPGQANPTGSAAMIEESAQRIPFIGPRITAAREKGWQQTQALIGQESAPPGYTPPARANPVDTYNDLKDAYAQAYGQVGGYPMVPSLMRTQGGDVPLSSYLAVPKQAAADPKSRQYVQSFIDNELGRIKGRQITSADLLDVRSNIRTKLRDMTGNDNFPDAEKLLKSTEQKATDVLESQLPPDAMAQLKAIDSRYGNFKVLESALDKAKDRPEGFTPSQFSMAVRESATTKGQYAGGGGRMRDVSSAASDVFAPRTPMTGAQQPSQVAGYVAAPFMFPVYGQGKGGQLARALLMGQTGAQNKIRDLERAFRRTLGPAERQALARVLGSLSSAGMEEKRPFVATTEE